MSEKLAPNGLTRRTTLKVLGIGAIGGLPLSTTGAAAAQTRRRFLTSFERENVGDQVPADPWYLFNDSGIHEVSDGRASHGNQSFRTAYATPGTYPDPSAIAIDIDFTHVEDILFDVYAVRNNPSAGNIGVSLDDAGTFSGPRIGLGSFPQRMANNGVSRYGGEGRWWRDEGDITGVLPDVTGVHSLIFWIDGDQDVYWDNIRLVLSQIEVEIDVKPCSDPNAIHPGARTVIPVAIEHTDEFDPVERVDVESLRFGAPSVVDSGGGASPLHGGHVEDVVPCDGDGRTDLVLHFPSEGTGFDGEEDGGRLEGETTDGTPLVGEDSVKIAGR